MDSTRVRPIPVTIVTGYLGAGKTSVVNQLVEQHPGQKVAVIQNEAGEISIDSELVVGTVEALIELSGGCLCCVVRADLVEAVENLTARHADLDHIVVELSGLADPVPVIHTFIKDQRMTDVVRLDAVIAVVSVVHGALQLENRPEAIRQVAYADLIFLTKGDISTQPERAGIEQAVRTVNAAARVSLIDVPGGIPVVLGTGRVWAEDALLNAVSEPHRHDSDVGTVTVKISGEFDPFLFYSWLGDLIGLRSHLIFRMKGVVAICGREEPLLVQGVHAVVETHWLDTWGQRPRGSTLVFIGRSLDETKLRYGLERCLTKCASLEPTDIGQLAGRTM